MSKYTTRALLAFALAVTLAGCASAPPTAAPSSSSATSTHTDTSVAVTTTKPLPPPPPPITGDQLSGTVAALDTVFEPCGQADISKPTTVFDPATGRMVEAPVPPAIPSGSELAGRGNPSYLCTLTGTPNDLKIFYVWNYRTPSKGLDPESFHLMVGVAGIHDKTMTQVAELPAEFGGAPSSLMPTEAGPVLSYCCRSDGVSTAAIDPNTLAVRWTSEHSVAAHDRTSVAFYDVFASTVTIRDVAAGTDTVLDSASPTSAGGINPYSIDTGYVIYQTGPGNIGYYSTIAHQFFSDIFVDDRVVLAPQTNEGKLLLKGEHTLKLVDVTNGAVVFELSPDEVKAVDSYRFANSGDYLYIANQSDSPVIDIRTHQQVSSGWKVRPQNFLGTSWVLVDHRQNATEDCYESTDGFGCGNSVDNPEQITLQRTDNGVYPGPWF